MEMWYNWSMESLAAPSTGQAAEVLTMPGQLLFIYLEIEIEGHLTRLFLDSHYLPTSIIHKINC